MATKKIKVSDVVKQDVDVFVYLLVFGVVTWLSGKYLTTEPWNILFGGAANYVLYRIKTELKKEGYVKALEK